MGTICTNKTFILCSFLLPTLNLNTVIIMRGSLENPLPCKGSLAPKSLKTPDLTIGTPFKNSASFFFFIKLHTNRLWSIQYARKRKTIYLMVTPLDIFRLTIITTISHYHQCKSKNRHSHK